MTEAERIKNALLNVNTLAKNSIEYGKARVAYNETLQFGVVDIV